MLGALHRLYGYFAAFAFSPAKHGLLAARPTRERREHCSKCTQRSPQPSPACWRVGVRPSHRSPLQLHGACVQPRGVTTTAANPTADTTAPAKGTASTAAEAPAARVHCAAVAAGGYGG